MFKEDSAQGCSGILQLLILTCSRRWAVVNVGGFSEQHGAPCPSRVVRLVATWYFRVRCHAAGGSPTLQRVQVQRLVLLFSGKCVCVGQVSFLLFACFCFRNYALCVLHEHWTQWCRRCHLGSRRWNTLRRFFFASWSRILGVGLSQFDLTLMLLLRHLWLALARSVHCAAHMTPRFP